MMFLNCYRCTPQTPAGMPDRFRAMKFDDFSELELERIWKKMCHDKEFQVSDRVSAVVRRRLSKQRDREGFGNARAVRTMFERAEGPARQRWSDAQEQHELQKGPKPELQIIITDVIGDKPDRHTTHPEVSICRARQSVLRLTRCLDRQNFETSGCADRPQGNQESHVRSLRHDEGELGH